MKVGLDPSDKAREAGTLIPFLLTPDKIRESHRTSRYQYDVRPVEREAPSEGIVDKQMIGQTIAAL